MNLADQIDWEKGDGLTPAVIQDVLTGRVLMLGYMNREALEQTQSTGQVTFYSRTRQRLWTKGETSGNTLVLDSIQLDCDHDTVLVVVRPRGPTCHLNTYSCFDDKTEHNGFGFLGTLESVIEQRIKQNPDNSYTARLSQEGTKRIAQKVGEEAVEVALAATNGDPSELINEAADLLYHLTLVLKHKGLGIRDVATELKRRHHH